MLSQSSISDGVRDANEVELLFHASATRDCEAHVRLKSQLWVNSNRSHPEIPLGLRTRVAALTSIDAIFSALPSNNANTAPNVPSKFYLFLIS